jgi:hypothetical protein
MEKIKSINRKYDGYLIIWDNGDFGRGYSLDELLSILQNEKDITC